MGCTPVTKTVDHSGFANYFTYKTDDELGTNPYLSLLKYLNAYAQNIKFEIKKCQ